MIHSLKCILRISDLHADLITWKSQPLIFRDEVDGVGSGRRSHWKSLRTEQCRGIHPAFYFLRICIFWWPVYIFALNPIGKLHSFTRWQKFVLFKYFVSWLLSLPYSLLQIALKIIACNSCNICFYHFAHLTTMTFSIEVTGKQNISISSLPCSQSLPCDISQQLKCR